MTMQSTRSILDSHPSHLNRGPCKSTCLYIPFGKQTAYVMTFPSTHNPGIKMGPCRAECPNKYWLFLLHKGLGRKLVVPFRLVFVVDVCRAGDIIATAQINPSPLAQQTRALGQMEFRPLITVYWGFTARQSCYDRLPIELEKPERWHMIYLEGTTWWQAGRRYAWFKRLFLVNLVSYGFCGSAKKSDCLFMRSSIPLAKYGNIKLGVCNILNLL